MVDDRIAESIAQTLIHPQPGMFMAKAQAKAQPVTPCWTVHTFVEVVIQIAFNTLLFQTANRTARFAAGLEDVVSDRVGHRSVYPFLQDSELQISLDRSKCNRFFDFENNEKPTEVGHSKSPCTAGLCIPWFEGYHLQRNIYFNDHSLTSLFSVGIGVVRVGTGAGSDKVPGSRAAGEYIYLPDDASDRSSEECVTRSHLPSASRMP